MTFWKATRPDGTDFYSGTTRYIPGEIVHHPLPDLSGGAGRYLSIADTPTQCYGMKWPCRLFEVEPVGEHRRVDEMSHKVACKAVHVIREVDATISLGPQGSEVVALIERASQLTGEEIRSLEDAWDAARDAEWDAARGAAWDAARDAAWDAAFHAARDAAWDAARDATWNATWNAAWDAASDAVWALFVRDLISDDGFTQNHYDLLTRPWASVIGPIHPDDIDLMEES